MGVQAEILGRRAVGSRAFVRAYVALHMAVATVLSHELRAGDVSAPDC